MAGNLNCILSLDFGSLVFIKGLIFGDILIEFEKVKKTLLFSIKLFLENHLIIFQRVFAICQK